MRFPELSQVLTGMGVEILTKCPVTISVLRHDVPCAVSSIDWNGSRDPH